jgi:hypothetical protein
MSYSFELIFAWLRSHQNILGWAGLLSLIMVIVTLLGVPLIVISLPSRYLNEPEDRLSHIPSLWRWPYRVVKNIVGSLLVIAGVAMLVLPGQGLLTLAIGLGLMNFPGKRRLIRRLIGRQRILRAINRLRARAHKAPLEPPTGAAGN